MQVAARLICEALKEFASEAKSESTGQILPHFRVSNVLKGHFVQSTPDEIGAATEVDDAAGEAFVHGNVGFALLRGGDLSVWIKGKAVAAESFFVAEGLEEGLAEGDSAVFDGVMGVHFEVAFAAEAEVHYGVAGEKGQHVVEEGDAGLDGGFAGAVDVEAHGDSCFRGLAIDARLAWRKWLFGWLQSQRPKLKGDARGCQPGVSWARKFS